MEMTQEQFIQSELYKLVKFDYPELSQLEVVHIVNSLTWEFSEDEKKIHIFDPELKYNHVYRWSDEKGILGLCNAIDEDAEFDEKYQEGEE